jgi:hypothetical protein
VSERLVLIILIDALGHRLAADPAYLAVLDRPRAPIRTVLGYSSAAIPTLMTGEPPVRHGHLSMYRRAGKSGVFGPLRLPLRLAARARGRDWRLRCWLTALLRRRGITGYFSLYDIPLELLPLFDLCQKRDLFSPGAFPDLPGLPDYLERHARGRIWNWSVPEEQALGELEGEIERGEKNVLFLYTSELDALMHAHGPEGEAPRRRLRAYDERITPLLARVCARGREPRVFVFGDHGMAPVHAAHDLWVKLRALPLGVPRDYLYFLDSTMARFWCFREGVRTRLLDLLRPLTYGRVLDDAELEGLGVLFPGREYGEIIFLLHEGEILVPSFMGRATVAAMHGYHPDGVHSSTTLLTNVQDRPYPRDLLELHHLLRAEIEEAAA